MYVRDDDDHRLNFLLMMIIEMKNRTPQISTYTKEISFYFFFCLFINIYGCMYMYAYNTAVSVLKNPLPIYLLLIDLSFPSWPYSYLATVAAILCRRGRLCFLTWNQSHCIIFLKLDPKHRFPTSQFLNIYITQNRNSHT